jgi:probable rRNA maturation factor
MINLEIDPGFQVKVESTLIEGAALTTLRHQSALTNTALTIVITGDEQIHELNRQYLDVDAPTDVLSFATKFIDPESQDHYLGDVIISYPRAAEQAQKSGHPVEDELQLLVVHGVLHLFGHDHAESEGKDRMWKAQFEILSQLGVENIKIENDG